MPKAAAVVLAAALFLAGCGGPTQEMQEARSQGIALMESGDYEGAVEIFNGLTNEARRVTDFETDVLEYRAEAEFCLEDYEAAAHTYATLAKLEKKRAEFSYMGALALSMAGDTDAAMERLSAGKEADKDLERPGYEEAVLALAKAFSDQGQAERAALLYEELSDNGFENTELLNFQMMGAMEAGEYETALSLAERGLSLSDELAKKELAFNQAVCYEYMGQYEKALELFLAYTDSYGSDARAQHEITFLSTR